MSGPNHTSLFMTEGEQIIHDGLQNVVRQNGELLAEIERLRAALEAAHEAMMCAVGYGVTEEELQAVKSALCLNQQSEEKK